MMPFYLQIYGNSFGQTDGLQYRHKLNHRKKYIKEGKVIDNLPPEFRFIHVCMRMNETNCDLKLVYMHIFRTLELLLMQMIFDAPQIIKAAGYRRPRQISKYSLTFNVRFLSCDAP